MFEAQRSEAFPPSQLTCESHRNIHAVWPRHVSAVCSHSESDLWELVFNDNSAEAGFLLLCQRRSFIQNDAEIKSVNFYSNKNRETPDCSFSVSLSVAGFIDFIYGLFFHFIICFGSFITLTSNYWFTIIHFICTLVCWCWGTVAHLQEGQVVVLLRVGDLQVLQHHGAVGVHPHHAVVVLLVRPQQRQVVAHSLTHWERKRGVHNISCSSSKGHWMMQFPGLLPWREQ